MSLLRLNDIGKIYVSEGNVAVGIRGVNLSFDRGEFVAITGKSGSGKSTLLNVISGMDSYEEGELLIEGHPTSHYMQSDWEGYREKYISFIFQDYNILDSFTVLENVELALMNIDDKKERRKRALELIERVGLSSHIHHKGSKLSGGQKQRTVIARALAKDSPIILADEPTGNLDFATSAEIMNLLYEVSRDKLLIVVTHSFDELEKYATRHIRIFDGTVESDHIVSPSNFVETKRDEKVKGASSASKKDLIKKDIKNGFLLGKTIFTSKPKLSIFLCLLMIIGMLGIFAVTSLCSDMGSIFEDSYMFSHIDGRLIITKRSGEIITDQELAALSESYGAKTYLHYDMLLDEGEYIYVSYTAPDGEYCYQNLDFTYGEHYGDDIIGRYPKEKNEVFLYLPISYKPDFGEESILTDKIIYCYTEFDVVGIKYYYDNNILGKCLFTKEGFDIATAVYYAVERADMQTSVNIMLKNGASEMYYIYSIVPCFELEENKIYISKHIKNQFAGNTESTSVRFVSQYYSYNYYYDYSDALTFEKTFGEEYITDKAPTSEDDEYKEIFISPSLLYNLANDALSKSYTQASLFFADDEAAKEAALLLNESGYIAVPSCTTYKPSGVDVILGLLTSVMFAVLWLIAVVFLSFFVYLCSSRVIGAFKADMAIMRSMGIPVRVIRIAMYARMLISVIPAIITSVVVAILIFTTPAFNSIFVYLYPWQYILIFLGMIILTIVITHKQLKNLFGFSVKKTLRGGDDK